MKDIRLEYSEYSNEIKGVYAQVDNDFQAIILNDIFSEKEKGCTYQEILKLVNCGLDFKLILVKSDCTYYSK